MELAILLKECKEERITAQKWLFDQFSTRYFLLCRRYLRSNELAEECMMNGFLCIFKALPNFEYQNDGASIAWMKRIMINECLRSLRKKEPLLLVVEELSNEMPVESNALDKLAAEELFQLITQLPIGYRTVFNLYAVEGFKHREIARELGITEGTSKSQLNKARMMLQQLLAAKNNESNAQRKTK
jgi:RNA polymerase sigma-70 factor (ECF subfamily)